MVHAHVAHGEVRHLSQGRNFGRHAQTRCQGRTAHAGAVDSFGNDGVGAVLGRPDDDVISLGDRNLELVGLDRAHVLAVGLDDRHRQAGNADVEDRHRRGVDNAQPHTFAGPEQAGPVLFGSMAVDQIGVGRAVDVEDVARVHPHLSPHAAFLQAHPVAAVQEARQGRALPVEVAGTLLQLGQDFVRMQETPVRKHQHMLVVVGDGIDAGRIDDERAVVPHRFLKVGVAVIPERPRLLDRELVDEGLARLDAGETDARHAIHLEREQKAVPVDRGVLIQGVGHRQSDILTLP